MSELEKQSESGINISEAKAKKLKKISLVFGVLSLSFSTCAIVLFSTLWILYNVNRWDSILWHPLLIATLVLIIPAMPFGIVGFICGKTVSRITKTPITRIAHCGYALSLTLFCIVAGALFVSATIYSFMPNKTQRDGGVDMEIIRIVFLSKILKNV